MFIKEPTKKPKAISANDKVVVDVCEMKRKLSK